MDGNGRWARSRGLERFLGHRKGTQATIDAVEVGVNLKLEHMTLYVFSSENWGRPSKEVDYLMNLLIEMVVKEIPDLMEKNVKLTVIGNMNRLPDKPRASLQSAIDKTANNTGMQLNLAISYGGRQEIVDDRAAGVSTHGSHLIDSLGHFTFFANKDGLMFVNMVGYDGSELIQFHAFSESRRDTVDLGDIKLKPTEALLKMVEVNARARRFTMSGDTIVFHPEAFHLEEGARLEELIRKLPGVSVGENGLSWNGHPLRIIMNGKDLFDANALVGMLPVEAVENIKAYNKASEFSQRTGKDDGTEDMVLDLTIKPGFLDRLYGDATVLYQTPNRYEGEVVANRLSDHDPLMAYVNANNRNRYLQHTMMSRGGGTGGTGFGLGQYGSFGYQHNWGGQDHGLTQQSYGPMKQTLQSYASVTGIIDHNDHWGTNYNDTHNYFPGEVSNRLFTSSNYHDHSLTPTIESAFRWQKDSRNTLWLNLSGKYGRQRGSQDEQTEQTMLTDSMAMTDAIMMRSHTQDVTTGEQKRAEASAGWTHYMPKGKGSVELTAKWNLTAGDGTGLTVREVEYPAQTGMDYTLRQDYQSHTNANATSVSAEVKRWLTNRVLLTGKYTFGTKHNHDSRNMQTDLEPSAADSA